MHIYIFNDYYIRHRSFKFNFKLNSRQFLQDDIRIALPREIIDLVISFMDIRTKRRVRSTNKYWFQYIQPSQFTIYFASQKTIPKIAQHFYQLYGDKPIGLKFKKLVLQEKIEDFPVQHFARLSHLTSLKLDLRRSPLKNATALTTLTNLLNINTLPLEIELTNLTALLTNKPISTNLKLYTSLRKLRISAYSSILDPFALIGNPSRLTRLNIEIRQLEMAESSYNIMTQFKNLTSLHFYQTNEHQNLRFLQYLTNVEKLDLFRLSSNELFCLTRLTSLAIVTITNMPNLQGFSALQKLRLVTLPLIKNGEFSFMSHLTDLENLSLNTLGDSEALAAINSQKITRLELRNVREAVDLGHLSKLSTLLELHISENFTDNAMLKSYDGLIRLTNLTTLCVSTQAPNSVRFTVVNCLTNLVRLLYNPDYQFRHVGMNEHVTFSKLTNLESLTIGKHSQTVFNELQLLTRLTCLVADVSPEVFQNNPTVLNGLPLKEFSLARPLEDERLWHLVTNLTNLEFLDVWRVRSEEIIESLSVLTNLTSLTMSRSHQVAGIHLTKLTSLQELRFISKQARKIYEKSGILSEKLTRLIVKIFRS